MMARRFNANRTLEIGDEDKHYRDSQWYALFMAMKRVAPDNLRDLGRLDVDEWLRECHLDASDGEWVRSHAQQVRENWQLSEHLWTQLDPGMVVGKGEMVYEPELIQLSGWSPQTEPETDFRERMQRATDEHIENVLAAQPWFQSSDYRDGMRGMRWLVEFQVLGRSWAQIADDFDQNVQADAVRHAVRRLVRDMGLKIRTD